MGTVRVVDLLILAKLFYENKCIIPGCKTYILKFIIKKFLKTVVKI